MTRSEDDANFERSMAGMTVQQTLEALARKINVNPEGIGDLDVLYQFDVSGDEAGTYQIRFKDGHVDFKQGIAENAGCTLQLSSQNLLKLIDGSLNATTAFMMGKLKVKGDIASALTLQSVLKKYQ